MSLQFLIVLVIAITVIVSVPLGFAAISYSFVLSITDADGAGGNFDTIAGIVTDSSDRLVVIDDRDRAVIDNRIQIFNSDGTFVSSFKTGGGGISTDDDKARDVTIDSLQRIIVADQGIHAIKIFDFDGTLLDQFGSEGTGDGEFDLPISVTTDSSDRIIVVDSFNYRIQIFDSNGGYITQFGSEGTGDGEFDLPASVATDSLDRIIVADYYNSRIQIFDSNGGYITQFGSEGTEDGEFDLPIGVATDSLDRIIVSELDNHRIQIFDSDGNYLTQFGSIGSEVGEFKNPYHVTADSLDRIIVSDATNHRIQIFEIPLVNTSSGCNSDCKPPSLESLELNNISNWLTAKNQTFNIGDKQELKFVYYDNEGIDEINDVKIGFGLPYEGSPMYKSEIILKINTNNEIFESLEIDDENKLFLENSTTVNIEQVQCGFYECLEYTLEFVWAEIPFDGYFLITATDDHQNTSYDGNEEAFTVIGETLNEEPTISIYNRYTSSIQDGLFIDITRTEKVTDMWIDEKHRKWMGMGNDQFELVH